MINALFSTDVPAAYQERFEKEILEKNIRNCEYTVFSKDGNVSKITGHKKSNKIYFKEKYGVDLIIK